MLLVVFGAGASHDCLPPSPTAAIAVCLPRAARFDSLFEETNRAFAALGVGYLVIDQAGNVGVLVEPRGSQIGRGAAIMTSMNQAAGHVYRALT